MNPIKKSITTILEGAGKAFKTFPATLGFAVAFALITVIRIQLEWPQQEPYNFLFNCLHWSFALGAIFSLATITAVKAKIDTKKAFMYANVISVLVVIITFISLYMFSAVDPDLTTTGFTVISNIAAARVSVLIFVSMLSFIIFAGFSKEQFDFAKAFFMTHKAFFIALLYGGVIMAGASGVAGAVEALLYNDMSSKVYMYISTFAGFLAFSIFVGYFPDFRKGKIDEHRQIAQNQPRYIEILFGNILVPIVLSLTIVLLIWAGKTIFAGITADFYRLYGIAAAYTIGGIWLYIMITHYETGMPKFYKRVYPIAALIILIFEAWALIMQLSESGLKFTEYTFLLIWILAVTSTISLLIFKQKAHRFIVIMAAVLAIISILPIVGYNALPVTYQSNRLNKLLTSENMLVDNQIVAATTLPDIKIREAITDAVDYLAYADDAKLPSWFDKTIAQSTNFEQTMGFQQVWSTTDAYPDGNSDYMSTNLSLKAEPVDISGYRWAINPQQGDITLIGEKGSYDIYWDIPADNGIPTLRITQDNITILEQKMDVFLDTIASKYPPDQNKTMSVDIEDMSIKLTCTELSVYIVIQNVDIYFTPKQDMISYWINLNSIYINEN